MHSSLARVLLTRGAINRGTIIQAYQNVKDLSCLCHATVLADFVVKRARLVGETVIFDALDSEQVSYAVASEQVIRIDGMDVERIARSQYLTLEGVNVATARRGRRRRQDLAAG